VQLDLETYRQTIREDPVGELGVFTSTTLITRGSTSASAIAPLVSSDTRKPASHSAVSSSAQPFWARGSPPVTHA